MLFTSQNFIVLVLITLILYYLPFLKKFQVPTLILSSFIFYASNNFPLLSLLLFSIFINVWTSHLVLTQSNPRLWATIGVIINLLTLSAFKYFSLISTTIMGDSFENFLVNIPLPIGISFFTFQGISLLVDTFQKDFKPTKGDYNVFEYTQNITLFISFFPQLIAGPIVKAHEFLPQIKTKTLKDINTEKSFRNIVLGYFLKMVISDQLKLQTYWMAMPYLLEYSTLDLFVLLFGYSMQIFADFAGYSLIAIGISGLFGYKLNDNFDFPYISSSFSEFWRRWHISLSTFLKEYLYIPLGGNRKGKIRTYINLFIVMFLGGLWHGAAWSYAVWGSAHGIALAVERLLKPYLKTQNKFLITLKRFGVFLYVTFAWLLFKLPKFDEAFLYVKSMTTNFEIQSRYQLDIYILIYATPIFLYHLYFLFRKSEWFRKKTSIINGFEITVYATMILMILINKGQSGDFIYFQF